MKKLVCFVLMLCMIGPIVGAEGALELIPYEELPPAHRQAFEAERQKALADAAERIPADSGMPLMERAAPSGYTDSRTDGTLEVIYTVSATRVLVGQPVEFSVELSCSETPMYISYSGVIMDEAFGKTGEIRTENYRSPYKTARTSWRHTPDATGYFCFVLTVSDGAGNRVSFSTNTIQVLKPAEKTVFTSRSVDGVLTAYVSLDKREMRIGETVTASCSFAYDVDPIRYTGCWKLYDEQDRETVLSEFSDMVLTGGETVMRYTCTAEQPGEIVFQLEAEDGEDHRVLLITPGIPVKAERTPGDANEDGLVNIFDALAILQHDVGWDAAINISNADVNADGSADIFDALLILQHDVGWDVELL